MNAIQEVKVVVEQGSHDFSHMMNIWTSQGWKVTSTQIQGETYKAILVRNKL